MKTQLAAKAEIRDLFNSVSTVEELETRLSMMERLPVGINLWNQILYLSESADELHATRKGRLHDRRSLVGGGEIIHLSETTGRRKKKRIDGLIALVPCQFPGIVRMFCVNDTLFWKKSVARFVRQNYPTVVRILFRQNELRQILASMEEHLGERLRIEVAEQILRERRGVVQGGEEENEYDSERKWSKESSIGRAFAKAQERRQWFKSLRLDFVPKDKSKSVASLKIFNDGLMVQDHLYDIVKPNIILPLERLSHQKVLLFAKKGLKERNYDPANPISINYAIDVFHDKQNVRKLAGVLKSFPHSSKAVFHGNPYLHMSLADFLDGSSFELWVLSPRRIMIVPQTRASVPSFQRLVSHIFENFKEGEVGEYSHG